MRLDAEGDDTGLQTDCTADSAAIRREARWATRYPARHQRTVVRGWDVTEDATRCHAGKERKLCRHAICGMSGRWMVPQEVRVRFCGVPDTDLLRRVVDRSARTVSNAL